MVQPYKVPLILGGDWGPFLYGACAVLRSFCYNNFCTWSQLSNDQCMYQVCLGMRPFSSSVDHYLVYGAFRLKVAQPSGWF